MPTPLLASASNGPSGLLPTWELPEIAPTGDDVLLVAFTQNRPDTLLDPPAGWDVRHDVSVTHNAGGGDISHLRYAMSDRYVPDESAPYSDTFAVGAGSVAWHAAQMAFRSVGGTPSATNVVNTSHSYGEASADAPTATAVLTDPTIDGEVLLAYVSLTTHSGAGPLSFVWPDGWIVLQNLPGTGFIGEAEVAYKVADGTETDVAVVIDCDLVASYVLLVAEYTILADPLPSPEGAAILYDVYRIAPPGDTIEYLATLHDATRKGIRPIRNEPGSGTFTLNKNSPNATADILAPGNLVKVRIPEIHSDHIFSFFMGQGDFTLVSPDEKGGEDFTFGGDGGLSYWSRAIWLSERFVIPWWEVGWGTPPVGARGHVTFAAGTYRRYTIGGGVITGYTTFTTAGFEAYFDSRQTYQWPSANSKRFLVHIMAGETHAGWFVHPHQDGVTETLPSQTVGKTTSVLLSDISPDTPGKILYHLLGEGTDPSRPTQPIPLMTFDFTDTLDSNGDPWATTDALAGLTAELGETYLETIVKLLSTGVIDVEMGPDLDMHAYNAQGRDLTGTTFGAGKVRFVKGVNIADQLRRERDDNPVATFIEVVGTDNAIGRAVLPDAASRVARETSGTGDSGDEAVLEAIGLAALTDRLVRSDAVGFRIATGDDDDAGLYLPGPEGSDNGDFWLGDLVTLHTGSGEQDFDQEDERVFAITIAEDDAGNLEVTPEVGSVLGEAERRLYAKGDGGASFTSRSQFTDTEVAEPPTGFVEKTEGGQETINAIGTTGAAEDIDPTLGNVATATLGDDTLFTILEPIGDADATLVLWVDTGAGGLTPTFDADGGTFVWNGTTPTLPTTAGVVYRVVLERIPGTTNDWVGDLVGGAAEPTFGTPAIILGTVAAAGSIDEVIRRDATIVAFDATAPTTQAFSDSAATGSAAVAARRDHVHGMPASPGSGVVGPILIADVHSTPLVFDDLLQNDDGDDLLYADI